MFNCVTYTRVIFGIWLHKILTIVFEPGYQISRATKQVNAQVQAQIFSDSSFSFPLESNALYKSLSLTHILFKQRRNRREKRKRGIGIVKGATRNMAAAAKVVIARPVTFVTGNAKKLEEVRAIIGKSIPLRSLKIDRTCFLYPSVFLFLKLSLPAKLTMSCNL